MAKNDTWGQKIHFFRDFDGYGPNILEKGQIYVKTPFLICGSWKSAESADLSKIENLDFLAIFSSFFAHKFSLKN